MKIQEIPEIPEGILNAASNGKLVVFIGAGVSRLIGYPSWEELSKKYVKKLYDEGYLSYLEYENLIKLNPRKLITICENFCHKKNISKPSLSELLTPKERKKYTDIYKLLYSWNAIYITTNFDKELEKVLKLDFNEISIKDYSNDNDYSDDCFNNYSSNNNIEIVHEPEKVLEAHLYSSGNIIHLHGALNADRIIFTISDYLYHYQQEEIQSFLNHLFIKFTVLFVGYGLEEYELLEFLVHKSRTHHLSEKKESKHYLLYPVFSWEESIIDFYQLYYQDFNIKLIPYPKDKNGYDQLYKIIKDWTPIIKNYVKSLKYIDKFSFIDEVIN